MYFSAKKRESLFLFLFPPCASEYNWTKAGRPQGQMLQPWSTSKCAEICFTFFLILLHFCSFVHYISAEFKSRQGAAEEPQTLLFPALNSSTGESLCQIGKELKRVLLESQNSNIQNVNVNLSHLQAHGILGSALWREFLHSLGHLVAVLSITNLWIVILVMIPEAFFVAKLYLFSVMLYCSCCPEIICVKNPKRQWTNYLR